MSPIQFVIVFSPDFTPDDISIHVDLARSSSLDLLIETAVLRSAADIERLARGCFDGPPFVVWNLYMEVDDNSRLLLERFGRRLVGSNHAITANTYLKSGLHRAFDACRVAHPRAWSIPDGSTLASLDASAIAFPVVVKLDAGYNSTGMSEASVCHDMVALAREGQRMRGAFGPVVIEQFVAGREFTVAVAANRAFTPIEKIVSNTAGIYLPHQSYEKRRCGAEPLATALRGTALTAAKAVGVGSTEYCRVDIRQDCVSGALYPIDVNDMCSVWPSSQFEASLAPDGASRTDLIDWLAAPALYERACESTAIYLIWHSDLSQIENVLPFLVDFPTTAFLYRWNECYDVMQAYLSDTLGLETVPIEFDALLDRLASETRRVVILYTSSLGTPFGQAMKRVLDVIREECSTVLDVVCVGHCVDQSSCSSCLSDIKHVPLKSSAYHAGRLPYADDEMVPRYRITPSTVLVAPTTGDEDCLLADAATLRLLKRLQETGRHRFLFKLHPSTQMMRFDDVYFQQEKAGYGFVREHFDVVAPEHFSVFPLARAIRLHITDLFSSIPAALMYFGDRIILAKDHAAVAADHPIRRYVRTFRTAAELETLLQGADRLTSLDNWEFYFRHFQAPRGDEPMQIAAERGWLTPPMVPTAPAPTWRSAVLARLEAMRTGEERRRRMGEIDQDTLEDLLSALGVWMPDQRT